MKIFIVLIKELAESFIRNSRLIFVKNKKSDINNRLKMDGIAVESSFYTPEECKQLRDKIDHYINSGNSNVWKDDLGADNRIYFVNEIDADFNKFYTHPMIRSALKTYTGTAEPNGMLLAARLDAKEGNLGSGGGWHRDSPITHQFKAICYLSDVSSENGPFTYIKGSHNKFNILKCYFKKILKLEASRFTEYEIKNYVTATKQEVVEVSAGAGSLVFADTKGIHRGKPIEKGQRYVLFCYFWAGEIPKHFNQLRQK